MITNIMIDSHPVEINTSAGWFYCYREQFGHDIMADMYPLIASIAGAAAEVLQDAVKKNDGTEVIHVEDLVKHLDSDIVQDAVARLSGMEITTVINILWAMVKNNAPDTPEPRRFINQFERLPMEEVVPALFEAIIESSASSKNSESLLKRMKNMNLSISI